MYESIIICGQIHLGKQGEHNARRFTFNDVKIWQELFGEGHCEVLHQRNGDSAPYPVVLTIENGVPYWYVSEVDTAISGEGKCEIRYIVNDAIVKSSIYVTVVQESLGEGAEEPPEAAKPWVDQVIEAAEKVFDATKDVEDIKTDIEKVKKDVSDANETSKQTIEQLEEATTKAKNEIDTVTKESKKQIQTLVQNAETSARNAEISAQNAEKANQSAGTSATKAEQSKKDIESWRSYESKLQWGGEHLANNLSPLDTSLIAPTRANRFALMNPDYITWERSSDGGATWKLYSVSNASKVDIVTTLGTVKVVDGNNTSINNQLRVTFDIPPSVMYMRLQKLYIEFGAQGAKYEGKNGALCTVEIATYGNPDTFKEYVSTTVQGDDGYNVIQMNTMLGKQSTSEATTPNHARKIRLTFRCDSLTSGRTNAFRVRRIYAIANTAWRTENSMQSVGTPYTVHNTGRTDFQNPIKAPSIESVVTRAIADENGNNIAASLANIESQIPIWNKKKSGVSFLPSDWKKEITMGTVTIKAEDKGFTYVAPYMSTAELNIEKASDVKYCLLEHLELPGYVTVEERRAFENAHMYIGFTYDSVNKKYQFYCGITSEEPPKIMIPTKLTLIIQRS